MSALVSSTSRTLPGTSLELRITYETAPATRYCDVCTGPCEGPRLVTFIDQVPQSEVCMDCARDITSIVKSIPLSASPQSRANITRLFGERN